MDSETSKNIAELEAKEKEFDENATKTQYNLKMLFQRIINIEGKCYRQKNEKCLNQIDNYWLALKQIEREETKANNITEEKCEEQVPLHIKMIAEESKSITSKEHYDAAKQYWECNSESRENFKNFALRKAKVLSEAFTNLKQFLPQKSD